MKIIIVTEYFPPENAIASLRLFSFAKYWHIAGHHITVLTTLKNKNKNDLNFDCSFAKVIRVPIPFLSKPSVRYSNEMKNNKSGNNKKKLRNLLKPLKELYNFLSRTTGCFSSHFPHLCDLWAKKTLALIDPSDYDVVVSSGGPYSVHRVGLALKKKNPKIIWIVDWRDLWTKSPFSQGLKIFRPYEKFLEKRFHDDANLISVVSDENAKMLRTITDTPVEVIYNGFEPYDYSEIKRKRHFKKEKVFSIVFTGSLYHNFQNLNPLFEAVSNLKQKYDITEKELRIEFAGPNADVSYIARKYQVSDLYTYLGFLPREDALQLQYDADTLLFFDFNIPNFPGILTGKLFEYMYIAKEIIAIGNNAYSDAANLISSTNSGIYLGSDTGCIEQYLFERIIKREENKLEKKISVIEQFSRQKQANKLLDIITQEANRK
jgi:hypothetical protein